MKPPIDRIDGPRDAGSGDLRRRGRAGLALIFAAKVVAFGTSIAFPLLLEAEIRSETFTKEHYQLLKTLRWVFAFAGTLVAWTGLALLAKVPKVAAVALAAVAAGVVGWALPFSKMAFRALGMTRGGLTSPFVHVELLGMVVGTAYAVLTVLVAMRAAEALSGRASRLVERSLYALYAVLLFTDLATVVVFNHLSGAAAHSMLDSYELVFEGLSWLGRGTQVLLIALFVQVWITTKEERAAEPA